MKKYENLKSVRGITLIALIITIIILLILSGVTIAQLEKNGLFEKSKLAKEQARKSEAIEKIQMAVMASYTEDGKLLYGNFDYKNGLENNLNSIQGLSAKLTEAITTFPINIIVDGYKIEIAENGTIKLDDEKNNNDNKDNNIDKEKEALVLLDKFEENWEGVPTEKISTENKKLGSGSLYLNYTEIINTSNEFNFSSDFTIDYWLNLSSENLQQTWIPILVVNQTDGIWIGIHSEKFVIRGYGKTDYLSIEPPTVDEWVHVAICRKDGIMYAFYNGILQGQTNNTVNFTGGNLCIGSDGAGDYVKNSYVDELRIINGTAKWTKNFIVPSTEYNSKEGIIYHFNYSEVSKSTAISSASEKKFGNYSKFLDSSYIEYGVKTQEKYKFDSDFTIDYWIKLSSENLQQEWIPILIVKNSGGMWIGLHTGKFIIRKYGESITDYLKIEPPTIGEWVHVAICRKNGVIYVFYNGILQGEVKNSETFISGKLYIGTDESEHYIKNSYVDELRILNGYCAWEKNFSVPQNEYKY